MFKDISQLRKKYELKTWPKKNYRKYTDIQAQVLWTNPTISALCTLWEEQFRGVCNSRVLTLLNQNDCILRPL